jgi:hypothetical protein
MLLKISLLLFPFSVCIRINYDFISRFILRIIVAYYFRIIYLFSNNNENNKSSLPILFLEQDIISAGETRDASLITLK